jgi:hypothetical protein
MAISGFEDGQVPRAKECRQLLGIRKGKKTFSRNQYTHVDTKIFSSVRFILEF